MCDLRGAVAMFLVALLLGGCRKTIRPDACVTTCKVRAAERGCGHPERCEDECTKLRNATACARELRAFMECFLNEPSDHWECSNDGLPEVRHLYCENQQDAVVGCLQQSGGKL
jgi:hypothetical protein